MATFDRKDDYLFIRWAAAVKKRDYYTCQICGRRGVELNAHHKYAWASYPEERYNVDNGITLCAGKYSGNPNYSCHELYHSIYGKGDNTEEEFDEYAKICEVIKKGLEHKSLIEKRREKIISALKDGYG